MLPGVRILRRLTLIHSDPSQNHRLKDLAPNYDILAIRPTTEDSLKQACKELDCDLISLDLTQRFAFHFSQFKLLSLAIDRGVKFEICYSPGILATDQNARRNLISNTIQILRATRGRGIVVSSESKRAIGCRSPWDVINLATVWGLSQERAKEALTTEARSVVVNAQLKRTSYRGAVDVIYGGEKPEPTSKPAKAAQNAAAEKQKSTKDHKSKDGSKSQAENAKKRKLEADVKELKASQAASNKASVEQAANGEVKISNREKKRREKKARYEAEKAERQAKDGSANTTEAMETT